MKRLPPPPPPGATPKPKKADVRIPQTFDPTRIPAGLPPHTDFATLFDLHYAQDLHSDKEEREEGVLSPSHGLTMNNACHRQCVLKLLRTRKDPPKEMRAMAKHELLLKKTAENGDHRHAFIQNRFLRMAEEGFMGISEVHIEPTLRHPTLRLKGCADIIICVSGHWYMIDIKTIGQKRAEKMFKPEEKHILQLNTYMGLSGIRTAYVMSEIRDDLSWLRPTDAFRIDFNPTMWASTLQLAASVTKSAEARILPVFDEGTCNRHKTFCDRTKVCNEELEGKDFTYQMEGLKSWP